MSEEGPTSWRNVTITMKVTRRTSPVPPCSFFYAYLLNGIYSVNRSGKLSVTFGFGGRVKLLEEELIRFNHKLLQDVVILDGDYQQTEKYLGSKSFFYYKPVNESNACTSYMSQNFGDEEQVSLADFCKEIGEAGGK
ncbi:DNA adenine methylase [Bacteroides fragilis]|jgi:site-specific DNA-adenine methylase|nr:MULTISPECIES: DNA adenine methylase [Bacteroides]MCS3096749.1 DNA adenine methylase [Bacteroides fragilis]MCZ2555131.1 DNA adenine methylase [Bacteroides fragilis]UVP48205.1 DNA adenine methylase [Bacteroides fragilis]